jgi:hypothetical protein
MNAKEEYLKAAKEAGRFYDPEVRGAVWRELANKLAVLEDDYSLKFWKAAVWNYHLHCPAKKEKLL